MGFDPDRGTQTIGLHLSPTKTRIAHLAEGVDFLGFHIAWQRKRGTTKWHVYTFIADKPVQALKQKIKSLTHRLSHLSYRETLARINYIQRGWANYFKHAVTKHTFSHLQNFTWWRVINWVMRRNRMTWTAIRRWLRTPHGWRPIAFDGVELFPMAKIPVTRYRYRGTKICALRSASADAVFGAVRCLRVRAGPALYRARPFQSVLFQVLDLYRGVSAGG